MENFALVISKKNTILAFLEVEASFEKRWLKVPNILYVFGRFDLSIVCHPSWFLAKEVVWHEPADYNNE